MGKYRDHLAFRDITRLMATQMQKTRGHEMEAVA